MKKKLEGLFFHLIVENPSKKIYIKKQTKKKSNIFFCIRLYINMRENLLHLY